MLFAVHLSDGVIATPWVLGGWVLAAAIVLWSAWRTDEAEIPRVGVFTAAVFVASQLHLPLGGVSVHLLLNGLVGVILRRRAGLAIAVGVTLQAVLFGHGGMTTLGLNISEYSAPALLAGIAFTRARRALVGTPVLRFAATAVATFGLITTGLTGAQWLVWKIQSGGNVLLSLDAYWLAEPTVIAGTIFVAVIVGVLEPRIESDVMFPLGVLLGGLTAYITVLSNCAIVWYGGIAEVRGVTVVILLAHLPVVAVEAVAVGFVVSFLSRVKPEWLGITVDEQHQRSSDSGKTSSSGTSH